MDRSAEPRGHSCRIRPTRQSKDFPDLLTWKLRIWTDGMSHLACLCDRPCGQHTIQRKANADGPFKEKSTSQETEASSEETLQEWYDLCSEGSTPTRSDPPPPRDWEPSKAAKTDMIPHSGKIYSQASRKDPCWKINPLLWHADTSSSSARSHDSRQHAELSSTLLRWYDSLPREN